MYNETMFSRRYGYQDESDFIENIARKREIVGILNGKNPELSELVSFCEEETVLKNDPVIGF